MDNKFKFVDTSFDRRHVLFFSLARSISSSLHIDCIMYQAENNSWVRREYDVRRLKQLYNA